MDYSKALFDSTVTESQQIYKQIIDSIGSESLLRLKDSYLLPFWQANATHVQHRIRAGIPEYFLGDPVITKTMVRRGWTRAQEFEQEYLQQCGPPMRDYLSDFTESRVGGPLLECSTYRCSVNTLGHLYYLARIRESLSAIVDGDHTVIEFGGGYGNFARLYTLAIPATTYVLVDLPEFLSLQYLFLKANFSTQRAIKVHTDVPAKLERKAFNLVPIYLLSQSQVALGGDVFISHFALSETTHFIQQMLVEGRFFNCRGVYLTGQYVHSASMAWQAHDFLHEAVKDQFWRVTIHDYHIPGNYELITTSRR